VLPLKGKPVFPAALPPLWGVHELQAYDFGAVKTVQL
jgi:hypothetical protein